MSSEARELEWFGLETRMRELIYQQLEPITKKSKEDREVNSNLRIYCRGLEKRLKELEAIVLGDETMDTMISKLLRRCAEIDGNTKKEGIRLAQEMQMIENKLESSQFSITAVEKSLEILAGTTKHAEVDLESIKVLIDENKTKVLSEVEKLSGIFQEMNNVYLNVAMKSDEKSLEALNKAEMNSLEMFNYKKEVDNLIKDIGESLALIREVKNYKVDTRVFDQVQEQNEKRLTDISFELQRQKDDILNRDAFIDNFIPLQTVTLISDFLHYFADIKSRRRIAEFEGLKLKELNSFVLTHTNAIPREDMMAKIISDMKHIEDRRMELLVGGSGPSFLSSKGNYNPQVGEIVFPLPYEETPKGPQGVSKEDVEKIVQTIISVRIEGDFLRFRMEMQKIIADINKTVSLLGNEAQGMNRHTLSELQDLDTKILKFSKHCEDMNSELAKAYDALKSEFKFSVHSLKNLGQMVVCLVENAQIEQILESQDEEDRHNIAYNFEKELKTEMVINQPKGIYKSSVPSGNFAFQKKCVSCGNSNSILSGFKTSLLYKPTPIFYRNKKFERPDLISLKGRILKSCWESTSSSLPWHQESFEKTIAEAARINLNKSAESIDNEFPLLATPTLRAKSTIHKKHRRGSINN